MTPIITLFGRKTTAWMGCLYLATSCGAFASEPLVARSVDGKYTVTAGEGGRLSYCRAGSNTVEKSFYICHPQALAFSEDGKLLAAVGGKNGKPAKIKVWQIKEQKLLCEIVINGEGPKLIAVSPDGRLVVIAKPEGGVAAWGVSDGKQQWSWTVPLVTKTMGFSADGKTLRVQGADGSNRLLDPTNGRESTRRTAT